MIKEALEFISGLKTPKNPITHEVDGVSFSVKPDGTLGTPVPKHDFRIAPAELVVSSLTGFVDAVKAMGLTDVAIHIKGPTMVELVQTKADDRFGKRFCYLTAVHRDETPFAFGKYYSPEEFLLAFRASFYFNDNAVKVQQLCSTVTAGSAVAVADDGISQEVTVTQGTVTRSSVQLPPEGVPLIPWRTFREANPVESKFLLRMKGIKDQLPGVALYEIDAKWKVDTVLSVRRWLEEKLPGAVIIS